MPSIESNKLAGKKLFVADQISCASSRTAVKHYAEFIERQGAVLTARASEADILLIDTCAYNATEEARSLSLIKENERAAKDGAKVIVCGCLAAINPRTLQEHYHGEFFSPRNEKHLAYILNLDEEEARFITSADPRGRFTGGDFRLEGPGLGLGRRAKLLLHRLDRHVPLRNVPVVNKALAATQAWSPHAYAIPISQGCLGNCSFCVIPMAKGRTTSLPVKLIVEKIRFAVRAGARRILLTSEDTGAYGSDLGTNIVELLAEVHELPERFDLVIHFFDPRWLRTLGPSLWPILGKGRIRCLQVPLQSGSNSVLHRMRRAYQIEQVLPDLKRMRRELPHLALSTQLIAGFPGETEGEFTETRWLIRSGLFDYIDVFEFSNRVGADAGKLPDPLSPEQIRWRASRLRRDWRWAKWRGRVMRDLCRA